MKLKKIIKKLLVKKNQTQLEMDYLIAQGMTVGKNLRLNSQYAFDALYPWLITVGDNVCISANVKILAHDTSTEYVNGYTKIGTVEIGNNVYIGYGSVILCNVHIGNNSIIGAGSVVSKDVPDHVVCAGNPAKVICTIEEYEAKHKNALQSHPVYNGPCLKWHEASDTLKSEMREQLASEFGYMK